MTRTLQDHRGLLTACCLVAMAALLGVFIGLRAAPGTATSAADTSMLEVAPGGVIDLEDLPPTTQALYLAAQDDATAFEVVRCYCGCEAFLSHRTLRDCFVRPDGQWERHGSACGVCIAEAIDVSTMRADGVPLDDIIQHIDDRFSAVLGGA
jgi:hypothetical protein